MYLLVPEFKTHIILFPPYVSDDDECILFHCIASYHKFKCTNKYVATAYNYLTKQIYANRCNIKYVIWCKKVKINK